MYLCHIILTNKTMAKNNLWTLLLVIFMALTACTKDGNTIYQTNPDEEKPSTAPLVTVIYGPNSLGDRAYCDKIYRGIEATASKRGLRTLQLMPESMEQGLTYLEMIFQQMESAQDSVRRLFIATSPVYDDFIRKNNRRLEHNPNADLLYLETTTPLEGKGSTLYIDYYGAMYMVGNLINYLWTNKLLLVMANPYIQSVVEASEGFLEGYHAAIPEEQKPLYIRYLSDEPGGGFQLADTTALRIFEEYRENESDDVCLVPMCGGAGNAFFRILPQASYYVSIDEYVPVSRCYCYVTVFKNIDKVLNDYIEQWENGTMPKHQTLGLADGGTDLDFPEGTVWLERENVYADSVRQVAIRKEAEHANR